MREPQNLRIVGDRMEQLLDELHAAADPRTYERAEELIVHGLHPDGVDARVQRALADVRPFLAQHGGDVELLEIDADAGAVLLRLLGSCDGCPSSAITLQHAVERAITEAAPEIMTIDVAESPADRSSDVTIPVTLGPRALYDSCPSEVGA
jgi:Fe-S cluster biogenesis protein NfuA